MYWDAVRNGWSSKVQRRGPGRVTSCPHSQPPRVPPTAWMAGIPLRLAVIRPSIGPPAHGQPFPRRDGSERETVETGAGGVGLFGFFFLRATSTRGDVAIFRFQLPVGDRSQAANGRRPRQRRASLANSFSSGNIRTTPRCGETAHDAYLHSTPPGVPMMPVNRAQYIGLPST